MKLSKRLEALYDLIPTDSRLVDIGTDHGLLMIRAIESGKSTHAYGLDINPMPLDQARENIARHNLEDKIELVLSDGLDKFEGNGDCFVLAGMGAETIWEIMKVYSFSPSDTIIVQSNTKHPWFRETVSANGFVIEDEVFLMDKGIAVFIMVLKKGVSKTLSYVDCVIGPVLGQKLSVEYRDYLIEQHAHIKTIKHNRESLNALFEVLDNVVGKGSSHE